MNASVIFTTERGNDYLFDAHTSYMLNLHPVVKTIHNDAYNCLEEPLYEYIKREHPNLSEQDIGFYINKYKYLREQGFFQDLDVDNLLSGQVTARTVERQLEDLDIVTFQITPECNLRCRYCCYGEMYDNKVLHETKPMNFETVEKVLSFLRSYWDSENSFHKDRTIHIGFYGGEPLLNFSLIEKTISYCKGLQLKNRISFRYSMTTNAMLLDRHAKYLVDNDFKILFSLDGNEKGNSLRVDKNQKPSFNRVFKNLKNFQHDYPEFFASNVEFNSVLSAMSSAEDVNNFIVEEFGKNPSISAMSPLGVSKDKMQEYRDLMQPYLETDELIASKKERSARVKAVGSFFYNSLNNSYKHYSEIIHFDKKSQKKIPGGTCLPFLKKMFITSDCKIMACERIGMEYELGTVDDKVNIDFEKVAELYTFYFSEVKKQCMNCYMVNTCSECIFQFPTENSIPKCPNIYSEIEYQHHLGRMMTFLEKESGYFNYVNNVVFG